MKLVKLKERVGNRQAGEVLRVDDGSAANLVDKRKVADYFDPEAPVNPEDPIAGRAAPRRGNVSAVAVMEEDNPNAPAAPSETDVVGEPADGEEGEAAEVVDGAGETHTEVIPKFTLNNSHVELVNAVVVAEKATAEEAQRLAKPALLAKLNTPADDADQ